VADIYPLQGLAAQYGYTLRLGDPDQGGWWLARGHWCQWFPTARAVEDALAGGCLLSEMLETYRGRK
jgi:hypothetical protein